MTDFARFRVALSGLFEEMARAMYLDRLVRWLADRLHAVDQAIIRWILGPP